MCSVHNIKWPLHILQNAEVEEEQVDERSVDDLLTFINGGDEGKIKTLLHYS